MKAVTHHALGVAGLDGLRRHVARGETAGFPLRCLPEEAEEFFRLHVVAPGEAGACPVEPGFAVAVVLGGEGALASDEGSTDVERGQTYVVPAGFGAWEARGDVRLVVARPGVGWPVGLVREEAP
jgi:mannose-6-phosphate isomerase